MLTCSCFSFGFLYSLYVPSNKSNVTSKKSTMCKFLFISILEPAFLKISIMSFRIRCVFCVDVILKSTSPSSLYKPVDCLSNLFDNKGSTWMPTSSQILAPPKLPMVTSKQVFVFFFFQGLLSLYNKNLLQFFIMCKSFSGISMYCWANRIALSNISSVIDG